MLANKLVCLVLPKGNVQARMASSLISNLYKSVEELPMREAVRYTNKENMKMSAVEFKAAAAAHANALLSHGIKTGDSILVWLPDYKQKHTTMTAAAMLGLKIFEVMPSEVKSTADLRQALSLSGCKALFFAPHSADADNLMLLRKAVPEFYHYDDEYGHSFHSKNFPNLKLFIQTGKDIEPGCLNYNNQFLPSKPALVDAVIPKLSDDMPLFSTISKKNDSMVASPLLSQSKVTDSVSWKFAQNIIKKQYFEV